MSLRTNVTFRLSLSRMGDGEPDRDSVCEGCGGAEGKRISSRLHAQRGARHGVLPHNPEIMT